MINFNKFLSVSKTGAKKIGSFAKKNLLGILIGGVIVGGISIVAADYSFYSSSVYYDNRSSASSSSNVSGALNDLYSKISYGNASGSQILSGYSALVNGTKVSGSMTNNGTYTATVAAGKRIYIPEGYHNGYGYIEGKAGSGTKEITSNGTYNVVNDLGNPETIKVDVPVEIIKPKDLNYKSFESGVIAPYNTYYVKVTSPINYETDDTIVNNTWTGGATYNVTGSKKSFNWGGIYDPYEKDWIDNDNKDGYGTKPSGSVTENYLKLEFSSLSSGSNPRYYDSSTTRAWDKLDYDAFYKAKAITMYLHCYKDATTYLNTEMGQEYFYPRALGSTEVEDIELTILKKANSLETKSISSNYDSSYQSNKYTYGSGHLTYTTINHDSYWTIKAEKKTHSTKGDYLYLTITYFGGRSQTSSYQSYGLRYKIPYEKDVPDNYSYGSTSDGVYDYFQTEAESEKGESIYSHSWQVYKNIPMAPAGYKYIYADIRYKE